MRDRRDHTTTLLRHGWGTERDTRAGRAADHEREQAVAAEQQRPLAVWSRTAATLRADNSTELPEDVHQLCADITELRAAVHGECS